MKLHLKGEDLELYSPRIMGALVVHPGEIGSVEDFVRKAKEMQEDGADFIEIGLQVEEGIPEEADELTKLEYDFFTKIDNGETNDIELHYDGFIIASGITDEEEFQFYRSKLDDIRNLAKSELSQYVSEGAYEFGKRLLNWMYSSGILKKYF